MEASREVVRAGSYAISSGHELASQAGMKILADGGNAIDAGVAAGLALGVLHSELVNVAGVAPIMIRSAKTGKVITIDGLGTWPSSASVDYFKNHHGGGMPNGVLRTVIPAAPAAWLTALRDFGTMTFGQIASHAIGYAKEGFPAFTLFANYIADHRADYERCEENRRIYLPGGRPPKVGELFVQSELAGSLQYMADQEVAAKGSRTKGLQAAYDAFYKGDIAEKICTYHKEKGGFLTREDLANYRVNYEEPVRVEFAGCSIYCCGPWSQGASLGQVFGLMERMDLDAMGHNSPDYIHYMTEVLKLVFADRERHLADPRFVEVPVQEMLSRAYLDSRLDLVFPNKAWPQMPPAGDPAGGSRLMADEAHLLSIMLDETGARLDCTPPSGGPDAPDTSYVCVIDGQGNMFSSTPSDTSHDGDVIPGTGLCPSTRGCQSLAVPGHINSLAPGKRPRLTCNPALALKDGKPYMTFGTPGGDVQVQAMAQVFANEVLFGMNMQAAIESPRFATYSFPGAFAPHNYYPGLLMLENRLSGETGKTLAERGHKVEWWPEWTWKAGGVCAIKADPISGELTAGADPRRAGLAMGI